LLPRVLLAAAALLYLWQIGLAPLWYDEAGTAWMASLPLPRLLAATAADTHPPLYFLLTALIERVAGSSASTLRLPSAVAAVAVLWLTWLIAGELGFSRRAALMGIGLLVLSPFQLHYAQEARMYALLQAEVLLALWAVLRRQWWLVTVALMAALWTHNYALIYAAVLFPVALWREVDRPLDPGPDGMAWANAYGVSTVFIAFIIPGLAWMPWIVALRQQMNIIAAGYWIQPVTPGSVLSAINIWVNGFALPDGLSPTGALMAFGLVAWLSIKVWQARTTTPVILWMLIFAPLAVVVSVSFLWKPILLFRGFAPGVPLLFLLAGWAIDRLPLRRQLYTAALVLPLLAAGALGHFRSGPEQKTALQPYAALIRAGWQDGDLIVHANEGTLMELHTALGDLPQVMLPRCARPNLGGLSSATQAAMGMPIADPDTMSWSRIWFVWTWPPTVTQCEVDTATAFLRKYPHTNIAVVRRDAYVEADIYLLERADIP
jgi:hypothetical protein